MTQHDETERSQHADDRPDDRPMPGNRSYPHAGPDDRTDDRPDDRPMPGTGTREDAADDSGASAPDTDGGPDGDSDGGSAGDGDGEQPDGPDAEPIYNDRDKLDFDPEEGLLSGTAIHGGTEIPGEHEMVDDVPMDDEGNATSRSDDENDDTEDDDTEDDEA